MVFRGNLFFLCPTLIEMVVRRVVSSNLFRLAKIFDCILSLFLPILNVMYLCVCVCVRKTGEMHSNTLIILLKK